MKKLVVVLMAFGFAAAAFSDDTDVYTWTGAAGDSLWETKGNWSPEPEGKTGPASSNYVFPSGDWTIRLDGSPYYYDIAIAEGKGTVTFVGSGKFQAGGGASIHVAEGRELCFDGPTLNFPRGISPTGAIRIKSGVFKAHSDGMLLGGTGKLIVEGGTFTSESSVSVTNSAELVVCGGTASCSTYWHVYGSDVPGETGGCIRLVSGTFIYDRTYTYTIVSPGGRFENLGGTIVWGKSGSTERYSRLSSGGPNKNQDAAFPDFLPPVGGSLILPVALTHADGALFFNVAGDYEVGGSVFVTNAAASTGMVNLNGSSVALRGRASIYANSVKLNGSTLDLNLEKLCLGNEGFKHTEASPTVSFLDGIVFGAWGDYPALDDADVTIKIKGPAVYDSRDCFDGATSHTIGMARVKMDDVTDLKATGGGSVKLNPISFVEEFRTLEVAAGTTLEVTNKVALKTMNLKLGAGATLKVDLAKGGYVDAAAIAEFGEGAKIVVTALPATLTEKTLYPVYFAPAGTDPDLAKIEFVEGVLPSGWTLAKTANSAYLTDGKVEPYSASQSGSTKVWSGAGADNGYSTAENWVNGAVAGSANVATFNGHCNTDIQIGSNLTVRDFVVNGGGPFVFSGSMVSFQYPGSQPSVWNYSAFPVVVNNAVRHSTDGNDVWALAFYQGSISLMGGSARSHSIRFGGDVRLGGAWEMPAVKSYPTYSKTAERQSRLTVMPGATVMVTDQLGDVNEKGAAAFAVAQNGVMTISGTNLTFSTDNTHYVDGTLTVNCPLVTSARQTFRGDGTLKLLGGVAASDTGVVRVEGNLTLVPSNWVNGVTLSVKDNVTLAPGADWTFGDDGVLEIVNHSTLTLAAGGHKISLAKPIVTEGTLVLKGAGKYEIGAAGMKIRRVTCADGAKITFADGFGSMSAFTDILTVREPDDSIAFGEGLKIKVRYDPLTGETTYSAKQIPGLMLIVR